MPGFDIPGIDTVLLARGYGCDGGYASKPDELERAIRKGLEAKGPYVLQVEVDPAVPALLGEVGPKTQYSAIE